MMRSSPVTPRDAASPTRRREREACEGPTAGSSPVFCSAEHCLVPPDNRGVTVFRRVMQLLYAYAAL
jgi:hypothetical protein